MKRITGERKLKAKGRRRAGARANAPQFNTLIDVGREKLSNFRTFIQEAETFLALRVLTSFILSWSGGVFVGL